MNPRGAVRALLAHNEHDPFAVAVCAPGGQKLGYYNRQKARALARVLDTGVNLEAVSIRGEGPGVPGGNFSVLACSPELMTQLRTARPAGSAPVPGD